MLTSKLFPIENVVKNPDLLKKVSWHFDGDRYHRLKMALKVCDEFANLFAVFNDEIQNEVKIFCKSYMRLTISEFLADYKAEIYGWFKNYGNDPLRVEWTAENMQIFLTDFFAQVERNPWSGESPSIIERDDWFNFLYSDDYTVLKAFIKQFAGVDYNAMDLAIKMAIICENRTNYFD